MKEALVIMTILGCDHGETACEYVATASSTYETLAQCQARSDDALIAKLDADYPVVMARCEAPVMEHVDVDIADSQPDLLFDRPELVVPEAEHWFGAAVVDKVVSIRDKRDRKIAKAVGTGASAITGVLTRPLTAAVQAVGY